MALKAETLFLTKDPMDKWVNFFLETKNILPVYKNDYQVCDAGSCEPLVIIRKEIIHGSHMFVKHFSMVNF
jgi:hypothetical protein